MKSIQFHEIVLSKKLKLELQKKLYGYAEVKPNSWITIVSIAIKILDMMQFFKYVLFDVVVRIFWRMCDVIPNE